MREDRSGVICSSSSCDACARACACVPTQACPMPGICNAQAYTGSASGVELPCGAPPAAVRAGPTGDSLISRSLSSRLRAARSLLCSCRISEAIVGRSKGHGPGMPKPKEVRQPVSVVGPAPVRKPYTQHSLTDAVSMHGAAPMTLSEQPGSSRSGRCLHTRFCRAGGTVTVLCCHPRGCSKSARFRRTGLRAAQRCDPRRVSIGVLQSSTARPWLEGLGQGWGWGWG